MHKTNPGWGIVGIVDPSHCDGNDRDPICVNYRIITCEVQSPLQGYEARGGTRNLVLHSVSPTTNETIDPIPIVRMTELDFSERYPEETTLSRSDLKFLSIVKEGIHRRTERINTTKCHFPLRKENRTCGETECLDFVA